MASSRPKAIYGMEVSQRQIMPVKENGNKTRSKTVGLNRKELTNRAKGGKIDYDTLWAIEICEKS